MGAAGTIGTGAAMGAQGLSRILPLLQQMMGKGQSLSPTAATTPPTASPLPVPKMPQAAPTPQMTPTPAPQPAGFGAASPMQPQQNQANPFGVQMPQPGDPINFSNPGQKFNGTLGKLSGNVG